MGRSRRIFQRIFGVRPWNIPPVYYPHEYVIKGGQSQGASQEQEDEWDPMGLDSPEDNCFEIEHGTGRKVLLGERPTQDDPGFATNTFGTSYPLHYCKRRVMQIPEIETITFTNRAVGGTGFVDNRWNPGDDLYYELVNEANLALADYPYMQVSAIILSNSENEMLDSLAPVGEPWTGERLYTAEQRLIRGLREEITGASEETPVFITQPALSFAKVLPRGTEILRALKAVCLNTPNVYLVSTFGMKLDPDLTDGRHWSGYDLRRIGRFIADSHYSVGQTDEIVTGREIS